MSSPAKRMRMSTHRESLTRRPNPTTATVNSSTLNPASALRTSTSAGNRAGSAVQHTQYDIITGEPIAPAKPSQLSQSNISAQPLRKSTSRQSLLPKPDQPVSVVSQQKYQDDTLALQAIVNKLEYENRNLVTERDMIALQHEKELGEEKARAETEYRKYQDSEAERLKAVRLHEQATKEIRDIRDRDVNNNASIEKRSRDLQVQNDALRDENEDLQARLSDADREMRRILVEEVEGKRSRLERTLEETTAELEELRDRFDNVNSRLQQKEQDYEALEKEKLELNSKVGGGGELELIKREFGEQMENVRRLEKREREQAAQIRKLDSERQSVNIVLEEKKALQTQIQVLKEIERRASELEIQKEILEDEKRTWTSLLEREDEEGEERFDSPEAVVKALVNERIQHALVLERLGAAEADVVGKDEALRAIEAERNVLKAQFEKVKETTQPVEAQPDVIDNKAFKRLERQQQLAKKEIEYLRAQLETFNAEETTLMDNSNFDAQRAEQIQRLEGLVTEYKSEIDKLHAQMSSLETAPSAAAPQPIAGQKRSAESLDPEAGADQIGHLLRKNKNLQMALQKTAQQSQMLATELKASKTQLKALRASTSTRILELRENPTAKHEAIKAETLRVLKQENLELMAQLRGDADAMRNVRVVPVSSLDAMKLELNQKDVMLAEKEKRMRRQREIWTEKAAEFRDVITSILGYKVTFLPNGKVKVRSMYYNPPKDNDEEELEEEDREDYIEFDGEKGTMKIGGGKDSAFGQDIAETIDFWVAGKKEIPCFLAAMQIELYDKYGGMSPEQPGNQKR